MAHLTVGFSGSGASRRALRWALSTAGVEGLGVHVMAVDPPPDRPPGTSPPSEALPAALHEELTRLPGRRSEVTTTTTTGDPVANLVIASSGSSGLVLGCGRRVGPLGPGAEGVLSDLVRRAPVPLVILGPQAVLSVTRRVLVLGGDDLRAQWTSAAEQGPGSPLPPAWRRVGAGSDPLRAPWIARHPNRPFRSPTASGPYPPVRTGDTPGAGPEDATAGVSVGDLLVVGAGAVHELPLRTLRVPVLVLPARVRTVVLPDTDAATGRPVHVGGSEGRRSLAGTHVSMSTGRDEGSRTT